ncbi:hypothetical protein RJ640_011156 [Escallonia rubra]|uniref:Salicylate carboxymethyltransferase n=1 Tax=Escallonia rubra TaxID=112253 RepID=A0AA88TZN5_9ASTE|nr:hypothetical protein RJ640_011156 [Escallonia rubra]
MDVERVFHMTGGVGVTSYAQNSSLQKKVSDKVKHITLDTIQELYLTTTPKSLGIADLGCSSGRNTLSIVRDLVDIIVGTSRRIMQTSAPPEFRVYLNDLPTNDFNTIFKALPDFYRELQRVTSYESTPSPSIYIAGYPGTFYGRLFPDKCLHFIYSSNSLHWLSKVPPALYNKQGRSINKGCIYLSKSSPQMVSQAYFKQFQEDFHLFLRSRSEELVTGGRMVLIMLGRRDLDHFDRGNAFLWELLTRSFKILVSQGEVEEEKFDAYDVHFYAPSKDELEDEVRREGSFEMKRLEMFEIDKEVGEGTSYGTAVATAVRAIQESMLCHHFGEEILDNLFEHYGRLVDEEMAIEEIRPITLVVVLSKL